jgi:hypothetical protein
LSRENGSLLSHGVAAAFRLRQSTQAEACGYQITPVLMNYPAASYEVSKIVIPACPESFFTLLFEYKTDPEGFPTSGNDRPMNINPDAKHRGIL